MEMNWIAIAVSALLPLVVGAIWYNPKVLGKAWMQASGVTEEQVQTGNMLVIFGLTYVFGLLASLNFKFPGRASGAPVLHSG